MSAEKLSWDEMSVMHKADADFSNQLTSGLVVRMLDNGVEEADFSKQAPDAKELLQNPRVRELVGLAALMGAQFSDGMKKALEGPEWLHNSGLSSIGIPEIAAEIKQEDSHA